MQNQEPKMSWLQTKLIEGAQLKVNPDKVSGKQLVKEAISISPLYLPKVKFWKSADVSFMWRMFCRGALQVMYRPTPRFEDFNQVCRERGIDEAALQRAEHGLKRTALIALFFFCLATIITAYLGTFNAFLNGAGACFISGVIYWKYSFRLWQVRRRSLDREQASIKAFMKDDWYLEALK